MVEMASGRGRRTSAMPQNCLVVATTDQVELGTAASVFAVCDEEGSDEWPGASNMGGEGGDT